MKRDWVVALLFFLVALAVRVPLRSQWAYHWDGAQFALAVNDYNVALSQPHAPGYYVYVLLGRLANLVVGDPHAALVWVSVVAGSLLVPVLFWLGTTMFDRRTGGAAAWLALTSPALWFHSAVALTYIVDALLVCLTVGWCWRAMARGGRWSDVIGIGALLAVAGGVRQQTVPVLVLVVLVAAWHWPRPRLAKLLAAGATAVVLALTWLWPTVQAAGGWEMYREIVRRHVAFNAPATLLGGGLDATLRNVFVAGVFVVNGLLAGAVVLVGALVYRARWLPAERKRAFDRQHAGAWWLLAAWLGPMVLFGTVLGFTKQPGYVLSYLPALLLLVAAAVAHVSDRMKRAALLAILCGVNGFAFLAWPQAWDGVFYGLARTARAIREHDRAVAQTVAAIQAAYRPGVMVLCHADEFLLFGLRHFQLHLPAYDQIQLREDATLVTPAGRRLPAVFGMEGEGRGWKPVPRARLEFVEGLAAFGGRQRLLVVPPGWTVGIFTNHFDVRAAVPVPGAPGTVYALPDGEAAR